VPDRGRTLSDDGGRSRQTVRLQDEVFGPAAVVVTWSSKAELLDASRSALEGQLTASHPRQRSGSGRLSPSCCRSWRHGPVGWSSTDSRPVSRSVTLWFTVAPGHRPPMGAAPRSAPAPSSDSPARSAFRDFREPALPGGACRTPTSRGIWRIGRWSPDTGIRF
jgi:hypothetical protein